MADTHPKLHPGLVQLWNEYMRREHLWAEDPSNQAAYRAAQRAFEKYDEERRALFKLLHPNEESK